MQDIISEDITYGVPKVRDDISYKSELTPTPILVRGIALYKIGVGVKFTQPIYVSPEI